MPAQHRIHWDRITLIATALVVGAAGACLPIPNTERVSPALTGVLRDEGGAGLQGVALGLGCVSPAMRTTTDSSGRFALPEVVRHHSWLPILGDRVSSYRICALEGDSGTVIYSWLAIQQSPPRTESLVCTALLRPVPNTSCREDRSADGGS